MKRLFGPAALSAAVAFGATPAHAEGDAVRLEYTPPDKCPGADTLHDEVQKRLKKGRLAEEGELARAFRIRIEVNEQRALAHMDFVDADGREATREVSAATCDEALHAIALVAALAIEARAQNESPAKPKPIVTPRAGEPSRVNSEPPKQNPRKPAAEKRFSPTLGFGALLGAEGGFAPKPGLRLAAVFDLLFDGPAFRGTLAYANSGPVGLEVETARGLFRVYTAGIEGCPLALRPWPVLAVRPCAGIDAGLIYGRGERSARITKPESSTEPWLSADVLGRIELTADPRLGLELEGGPVFPLIRQEFGLLNPDEPAYQVPAVGWRVAIGLLGRFE